MNQSNIIKLCQDALMNAQGAYKSLRLLDVRKDLPGLDRCEEKCNEALKAIEEYLKNM